MENAEYQQLVENLRSDAVLTSAPLVYRGRVLSGNHRVEAAIDAGIEEADVIEVMSELDEQRQLALQLSHNAINGRDDPGRLATLYRNLDLSWKKYSGLTDAVLNAVKELDITALAIGQPQYQELLLLFLPEQAELFVSALKKIEAKLKRSVPVFAGHYDDFARVFDAVVQTKAIRGINNSAVALRTMADIALRVLEGEAEANEDHVRPQT